MAKQATLINEKGLKQVVDVGSQQASSLMGQGYQLMGASGKYTPANPITPATPTTQQNIPTGAVAINGAEFNTGELQKANFSNIQPIGNTLYGIPKAPIVPDVMPQSDFAGATSPQILSEGAEKAKSMVGFTDKQISELEAANKRLIAGTGSEVDKKNVEYAKSKGWRESAVEEVKEPVKSTTDTLFETMSNLGNIKAKAKEEAAKTAGLDEKSQAIATAQSVVNQLRTDLQNQGILDIKEQDVIRAKPILTAQIQGQLEGLSREQKLDAMILQNNYNNALVEQQIAQGNYDRAREIVAETADDAYNSAKDYINALLFKNEIEEKAADKLDEELKYERDLALEGYVHIKSVDGLKGLKEDQIYRDPVSNKIYMKPAPKVAQIIDVNGRKIGIDEMGNKIRDYGSSLTNEQLIEAGYTIDDNGNLVKNTTGNLKNIDVSQLPNDVISGTPSWAQVLIAEKAKETGVPASLISAVINQESGFNPNAQNVNEKERSYGLGQINLNAHPQITKEQATDPGFAIDFVAQRLKVMINKYGLYEGVQAYNTPGAIGSQQLIKYANNILSKAGVNVSETTTNKTDQIAIDIFNGTGSLSKVSTKDYPKVQAKLSELKEAAKKSGDLAGIMRASAGGKNVDATTATSFEKAFNVIGQLGELKKSINEESTGPILGIIRSNNPYDKKAELIKAQLTALIPNLARGIYGEVGVLTDNDVALYAKTLPNLKSTEEVRDLILASTVRSVQRSIENKIKVQSGLGRDLSGLVDTYEEIKTLADGLESQSKTLINEEDNKYAESVLRNLEKEPVKKSSLITWVDWVKSQFKK